MKAMLLLIFAGIPLTALAVDRDYRGEYSYERMQPIYEWTCAYMAEVYEFDECPPQPVIALADTRPGLWGFYYRDSQIIWVSTRLTSQPLSVFGEAIIAHEMVHYLLDQFDDLQAPIDSCRNEGLAWKVFNEFVGSYGFDDLKHDTWWDSYLQCESDTSDAAF